MADPYRYWSPAQIADATDCNEIRVRENWPLICAALERQGIDDRSVQVAAIGTVAIETASRFQPIHEFRNADGSIPAIWYTYDGGPDFHGRGYCQLTHRSNYQRYGDLLGVDLVAAPDRALDPLIAAAVLALYFANHGGGPLIPQAAHRGDWREVRRLVQGADAGLDRFLQIVAALQGAQPMAPLPYDPNAVIDIQPDNWSCALQSAQFLLRSIGRNPDASDPQGDPWMRSQLIPNYITPALGLLDGSGRQLATWLTEMYGREMNWTAQASPVTFDDVWAGAGVNPTIVGGARFGEGGHWVGVRRRLPDGSLEIANPAPGYDGIGTTITREQWDARAPWSAIWVDRLSTLPDPPPPAPEPPTLTAGQIRAKLLELVAMIPEDAP